MDLKVNIIITLHRTNRLSDLTERQAERLARETPDQRLLFLWHTHTVL